MRAIRLGICVLLAFSVLAHGCVEPWSEAVLEIGAALLGVLWGLLVFVGRQTQIRWNPLLWPLLASTVIALAQLAVPLSVYPYLTKIELLKFLALLLLFFLAVQAFRTLEEWQGFLWFVLVMGFVVSLFGIIQHFAFNGKLYWMRELRYGGIPFGPYVNRNHFAGFVELVVPPGLAIVVLRAVRKDLLPLVALFTLVPIGALFLSASRGGITSFVVELSLLAVLLWAYGGKGRHAAAGAPAVRAAAVVLLLGTVLVAWLGVGRALERFSTIHSLEITEARRIAIMKDTWRIFLRYPWSGAGLGTFEDVYPRYERVDDGKVVNHAHNDYIEGLAEAGVPGALCFLLLIVLLFWSGLGNLRDTRQTLDVAIRLGALVACTGLLVHSLADFNLHIPSNALLFLLQSSVVSSPAEEVRDDR